MPTKTISIRDEAYERLAARKEEGESFSEVILRLTEGDPNDFSVLVGADIDVPWEDVERSRDRSRTDDRREALLRDRSEE